MALPLPLLSARAHSASKRGAAALALRPRAFDELKKLGVVPREHRVPIHTPARGERRLGLDAGETVHVQLADERAVVSVAEVLRQHISSKVGQLKNETNEPRPERPS